MWVERATGPHFGSAVQLPTVSRCLPLWLPSITLGCLPLLGTSCHLSGTLSCLFSLLVCLFSRAPAPEPSLLPQTTDRCKGRLLGPYLPPYPQQTLPIPSSVLARGAFWTVEVGLPARVHLESVAPDHRANSARSPSYPLHAFSSFKNSFFLHQAASLEPVFSHQHTWLCTGALPKAGSRGCSHLTGAAAKASLS